MSEAESALLGLMIEDQDNIPVALQLGVSSDMFKDHGEIFDAVVDLYRENKVVLTEITTRLPKLAKTIASLIAFTIHWDNPNQQHVRLFCHQIVANYRRKNLLSVVKEKYDALSTWDISDDLQGLERLRENLLSDLIKSQGESDYSTTNPKVMAENAAQRLEKIWSGELDLTQIPTGFGGYDKILDNMDEDGAYCVIAATTGIGKSTFAINIGLNISRNGGHCVMFSVEMGQRLLTERAICINAEIPLNRVKRDLTDEQKQMIRDSAKQYGEGNFSINTKCGRDFVKVENEILRLKREGKLDFVIIDYLQQFRVKSGSPNEIRLQVQEVSNRIQALKIKVGLPFLVCAQPTREFNKSKEELQVKFHIKECSDIENDADVIMQLKNGSSVKERCIDVEKNKFGPEGVFRVGYNAQLGTFFENTFKG